jgi:hypothetical protein
MKLKTATLLAILGSSAFALSYLVDYLLRKSSVSSEFYYSIAPFIEVVNITGRFLIVPFFISLYKNQK